MKIALIRHGMTMANEKRLYCGKTDLSLSEEGIIGIDRLRAAGVYPSAGFVVTSGMKRTDETALRIYERIDKKCERLSEISFGMFEMKDYYALEHNNLYLRWILDETGGVPCPGGESKNEFIERVLRCYRELLTEHESHDEIAIITHGGVISAIMENLFGIGFHEASPKPGCGYLLEIDGTKASKYFKKIEG